MCRKCLDNLLWSIYPFLTLGHFGDTTQAAKESKSDAQLEKERQRKEYRQRILQQHGGAKSSGDKRKSAASPGLAAAGAPVITSKFRQIFAQRAQGYHIDFKFRNAPPRPPVGPTWMIKRSAQNRNIHDPFPSFLEGTLKNLCTQYTSNPWLHSVETQYTWPIHTDESSFVSVALASTAMEAVLYEKAGVNTDDGTRDKLHPDDVAILNWKGSLGDTAAEQRKQRQDRSRAEARGLINPNDPIQVSNKTTGNNALAQKLKERQAAAEVKSGRKSYSRVLDDPLQTWMKKTTYLSNDFGRKVHDFKSLAQSKQELAEDLETKKVEIASRKSIQAIVSSFEFHSSHTVDDMSYLKHPLRKDLKPAKVFTLLPNVAHWGHAYTHVVMDKCPNLRSSPSKHQVSELSETPALIANLVERDANSRMSCQVWVPAKSDKPTDETSSDEADDMDTSELEESRPTKRTRLYDPVQEFDLDVLALKQAHVPHANFCIWLNPATSTATYLPIASRVQLSAGRPVLASATEENVETADLLRRKVFRRPMTITEKTAVEERQAAVDREMAAKHHIVVGPTITSPRNRRGDSGPMTTEDKANSTVSRVSGDEMKKTSPGARDSDDDGDDFGDDSSDEEALFGTNNKAIVAEG
jgi:Paf1